jgi:hypothetical protein
VTKFRQNMAVPLAAGVALAGTSALALQRWWLLPLLLIPAGVLWWGLRSGVDASTERVRVRALAGSRAYGWDDVAGVRVDGRRVLLATTSGTEVALPAVTPADVPRLIAASGGALEKAPRQPADQ